MCLSCGCGRPKASHGDSRNIVAIDLRSAAEAAGIDVHKAATNIVATTAKMRPAVKHTHDHGHEHVACHVLKAQDERRFTLGLAYPANRPDVGKAADGFRDFVSERALEDAAWSYLSKGASVGLHHARGTDGHGTVVESYLYRGPDWKVGDTVIKAGDWLLGVVWDDETWPLVKSGRLNGLSPQGRATRRKPTAETLAQLRSE